MQMMTILTALIFSLFTFCCGQDSSSKSVTADRILTDTSLIPKDSSAFYFPLNTSNDTFKNVRLDSFLVKWYSEQLFALREPIIYSDNSQNEIYRFTWLRTFHNPIAVRIERHGDNYFLYWKLSNGAGGYSPGKLMIDKHRVLEKSTWEEFVSKLNQIDFWNMATKQNDMGNDGSEWILEGKSAGKYHVVDRWTPSKDSKYYECCDFLLSLTDLKITGRDKY